MEKLNIKDLLEKGATLSSKKLNKEDTSKKIQDCRNRQEKILSCKKLDANVLRLVVTI